MSERRTYRILGVKPSLWQRFLARLRGEGVLDPQTGKFMRLKTSSTTHSGRVVTGETEHVIFEQKPDIHRTPGFGESEWERLLDQSKLMADAKTVFLMDSRGLIIACRGESVLDEVEGLGIRLLLAFEQIDFVKLGGETAHSMTVGFGDSWVTGLRLEHAQTQLMVGIIGPYPVLRRRSVSTIQAAFSEFLGSFASNADDEGDAEEPSPEA